MRDDAAHFRRCVELPLALATLCCEVAHEILVSVAEKVIAVAAILREVECRIFEDRDEVGEAIDLLLAASELCRVGEIWRIRQMVRDIEWPKNFLLIWSPMSLFPLSATMSAKLAPFGIVIGAYGSPAKRSLTYFTNKRTST